MPSLDESHDERILRILRDAKEGLTAKEVIHRLHNELGGGDSYNLTYVEARLCQLSEVHKDGDKYCLRSETRN